MIFIGHHLISAVAIVLTDLYVFLLKLSRQNDFQASNYWPPNNIIFHDLCVLEMFCFTQFSVIACLAGILDERNCLNKQEFDIGKEYSANIQPCFTVRVTDNCHLNIGQ